MIDLPKGLALPICEKPQPPVWVETQRACLGLEIVCVDSRCTCARSCSSLLHTDPHGNLHPHRCLTPAHTLTLTVLQSAQSAQLHTFPPSHTQAYPATALLPTTR